MKCEQIEPLLNALLDKRLPLSSDRCVAEHIRSCRACRRLAAGYESLLVAVEVGGDAPRLSEDFAARTVARAARQRDRQHPLGTSNRRAATGKRAIQFALAVAAVLLLAMWPSLRWRNSGDGIFPRESAPTAAPLAAHSELDIVDPLDHEQIWLATGRSLATFPITMRRVATFDDGEDLGSALRPVATSVTSTLESWLRMLPDEPQPVTMPNGGTSHCEPAPPSAVV